MSDNRKDELVTLISGSVMDSEKWREALFELIDYYPTSDTAAFLFEEMKKNEINLISGTYIYAIQECPIEFSIQEVDFLFNALINSNNEVSWMVAGVFEEMKPHFSKISTIWFAEKIAIMKDILNQSHENHKYVVVLFDLFKHYLRSVGSN